jgi:hypothetical protein
MVFVDIRLRPSRFEKRPTCESISTVVDRKTIHEIYVHGISGRMASGVVAANAAIDIY